jgi:hypothetical protein
MLSGATKNWSTTMNGTNRRDLGTGRRLVGVLAAVAVFASMFTALAPAASAEEKYGYLKVTDKQWYFPNMRYILHIDEEHATADGFWYAHAQNNNPGQRPFVWRFQPYGAWCQSHTEYVGMNKWLGEYSCLPDHAKLEAAIPGYMAERDKCIAKYPGEDYLEPYMVYDNGQHVGWGCDDWVIDASGALTHGGSVSLCAPWEPQTLTDGSHDCMRVVRYAWDGGGVDSVQRTISRTREATSSTEETAKSRKAATVRRMVVKRTSRRDVNGQSFVARGKAPVLIRRAKTRWVTAPAEVTVAASRSATCWG